MLVLSFINQRGDQENQPQLYIQPLRLIEHGERSYLLTSTHHLYTALTTFKPIPPLIVNERLHLLPAHIAIEQVEVL